MPSALIVGGVTFDSLIYLDEFPQPKPQTLFAHQYHETIGGTGAGKALNLARLGFDVTLHAFVGHDSAGRLIQERMKDAGVHFLADIDPTGTERHTNLMNATGERISIYTHSATFDPDIDIESLAAHMPQHDYVILNIINYTRRLIPLAQQHGQELWIDIHDYNGKQAYHQDFVKAADYLFMSSDALPDYRRYMQGRVFEDGKSLVVCTHGRSGATALTQQGDFMELPALNMKLVDSNGAGDAFFAGYVYGHAQGYDVRRCLQMATITGGLTVTSPELVYPDLSPERVQAEWQKHYAE